MSVSSAVRYPTSDGKPMAESELHREIMVALIYALQQYFKDDPQVYVGGNMLLYYEEGNPRASCAPDVFLVRGVPKCPSAGLRELYKVWEEGKGPDLVIEVTSKSTRLEDLGTKKALYAELGVQEYFLFDPRNEYLPQPFMGHRLEGGDYIRMEPSRGRLTSEVTGLELGGLEGTLRFFEPGATEPLPVPDEEAEARKTLEAEKERLSEEIERLRAELGGRPQEGDGT